MDKQMGHTHTMEYYLTLKGNEILINATWMNLENILLSRKSQSQKTHILYDFIHMKIQNREICRNKVHEQLLRAAGGKMWRMIVTAYGVFP